VGLMELELESEMSLDSLELSLLEIFNPEPKLRAS
jgi:hypothetical protein